MAQVERHRPHLPGWHFKLPSSFSEPRVDSRPAESHFPSSALRHSKSDGPNHRLSATSSASPYPSEVPSRTSAALSSSSPRSVPASLLTASADSHSSSSPSSSTPGSALHLRRRDAQTQGRLKLPTWIRGAASAAATKFLLKGGGKDGKSQQSPGLLRRLSSRFSPRDVWEAAEVNRLPVWKDVEGAASATSASEPATSSETRTANSAQPLCAQESDVKPLHPRLPRHPQPPRSPQFADVICHTANNGDLQPDDRGALVQQEGSFSGAEEDNEEGDTGEEAEGFSFSQLMPPLVSPSSSRPARSPLLDHLMVSPSNSASAEALPLTFSDPELKPDMDCDAKEEEGIDLPKCQTLPPGTAWPTLDVRALPEPPSRVSKTPRNASSHNSSLSPAPRPQRRPFVVPASNAHDDSPGRWQEEPLATRSRTWSGKGYVPRADDALVDVARRECGMSHCMDPSAEVRSGPLLPIRSLTVSTEEAALSHSARQDEGHAGHSMPCSHAVASPRKSPRVAARVVAVSGLRTRLDQRHQTCASQQWR